MNMKLFAVAYVAALITHADVGSAQKDGDGDRENSHRATVCRNFVLKHGRASAECSSNERGWRSVTAYVGDCRGNPIISRGGALVCGGERWETEDSDHPARVDAILFEDFNFRGASLPLRYDMPNLSKAGFDRRASSIRVREGIWEGCTQENYHGRCWKVTSDQARFSSPANDQIRSVRRLD